MPIFSLSLKSYPLAASIQQITSFGKETQSKLFLPVSQQGYVKCLIIIVKIILKSNLNGPFTVLFFGKRYVKTDFSLCIGATRIAFGLFTHHGKPALYLNTRQGFVRLIRETDNSRTISLSRRIFITNSRLNTSVECITNTQTAVIKVLLTGIQHPLRKCSHVVFSCRNISRKQNTAMKVSLFSPYLMFTDNLVIPVY